MKKIAFFIMIAFVLSISAPLAVKAAAPGDFCDPKKMDECQAKIDSLTALNKYANAMEYGNPKTNLSPRPFIRPAIESSKPLIRKMIVEVIKKRFGIK